jgi:hypothetical protein
MEVSTSSRYYGNPRDENDLVKFGHIPSLLLTMSEGNQMGKKYPLQFSLKSLRMRFIVRCRAGLSRAASIRHGSALDFEGIANKVETALV